MSKGYVYIMVNPSMPGLVKIGKTMRSPGDRARELYQTGVPAPFALFSAFKSPDCTELEQAAHKGLSAYRVSERSEFFAISAVDAH